MSKISKQPVTALQINDATNEQIPTLRWCKLSGEPVGNIVDVLKKSIEQWQELVEIDRLKFIVSCDSQRHGGKIAYVTTIVFLREGAGGQAFYVREVDAIPGYYEKKANPKERQKYIYSTVQRRLWNECVKAVKCALWLDEVIIDYGLKVSEIHEDINSNKKYRSNDMLKAIVGYIESVGYKPVIKPNAWVASSIADSVAKR